MFKKASFIPVFIVIAVLILVYFVFLNDSDLLKINKAPEVRRLNGFPTEVYTDQQVEKHRTIITNEEELSQFLNEIDSSGYVFVREEINFDKEILLGVSTDTHEYEGHNIKIRKLYEDRENNKLLVSLRESVPGETCEKVVNPNVAVDLVAISQTVREIEFERVKEVVECE